MSCRVCQTETEEILNLGSQEIPFATTEEKFPLSLVKCPECHLVQLRDTVDKSLLYNDNYGYRSGINETIKTDLKDIVSSALKLKPNANTAIDIGCNDGTLLSNYPEEVFTIGYEPVEKLAVEAEKVANEVDNTYFQKCGDPADIITAISMFYDLDNPNKFVADLKGSLKPSGIIIIQQNYLKSMLENNAYDNICHEHLEYYSLLSLEYLLNKHGLEVFRVEQNEINGGSFRTYICHRDSRPVEPSVNAMREEEREYGLEGEQPYRHFAELIAYETTELFNVISGLEGKLYAYGASTRGSVIVQYSHLSTFFEAVVERNPDKIGKTYHGIPIISEEEAKENPPDYKLILPYFHKSIIDREAQSGAKIILPLPEVRILEDKDLYPERYV